MKHSVKLFTFLFFFCINCCALKAQQKHFIYVQSEDKQPFAVVMGGKVFSSSDYGYVIIPKLTDSIYTFRVSFPLNKFPDQLFTCTINKKDAGYALKNGTEGWVLQNMQTQKLIANGSAAVVKTNAFGEMLSDVVSDSSLTKNTAAQQPLDTVQTVMDSVAQMQPSADSIAPNNASAINTSLQQPEKISELKLDTGTSMLFVDKNENGNDTIHVFVPSETINNTATADEQSSPVNAATVPAEIPATPANNDAVLQNNNSANNNNELNDTSNHNVSNPFYKPEQNANSTVVNSTSDVANQISSVNANSSVRQDCGNMINDDDISKLKRKMFVQKNDDAMVEYAVKYLNKKCITTDQVKLLGDLFNSDDGRYNLYDGLYKYVYDYGNFSSLESQILDPYYKKRFAAMLR